MQSGAGGRPSEGDVATDVNMVPPCASGAPAARLTSSNGCNSRPPSRRKCPCPTNDRAPICSTTTSAVASLDPGGTPAGRNKAPSRDLRPRGTPSAVALRRFVVYVYVMLCYVEFYAPDRHATPRSDVPPCDPPLLPPPRGPPPLPPPLSRRAPRIARARRRTGLEPAARSRPGEQGDGPRGPRALRPRCRRAAASSISRCRAANPGYGRKDAC